MNLELAQKINGKVLCGDGGARIPITKIEFVTERRGKDGDEFVRLEIAGLAKEYLVNANDPNDGTEVLPEPVPVVQTHDLEKEDAAVFLDSINRHFGLRGDAALVDDGGGWLQRFTEDGEKSVVPVLKEKGAYMKSRLRENAEQNLKFGSSPFFFNFYQPPERSAATKESLSSVMAKLQAKKAKKDAAKAEADELFG